jgi:hypothetical protein
MYFWRLTAVTYNVSIKVEREFSDEADALEG